MGRIRLSADRWRGSELVLIREIGSDLVRVRGIEPLSQVWKTCILTVVLHPHVYGGVYYSKCTVPFNSVRGLYVLASLQMFA